MPALQLYTDGSAGPTNPGPGGWAVTNRNRLLVKGSEPNTTNIQMEGRAIIEAMRYAAGAQVEINSDSQFWVKAITEWAPAWERKNWRKSNGDPVANVEMVQTAVYLYRISKTRLIWVRGHNGDKGNELADHWAGTARVEGMARPSAPIPTSAPISTTALKRNPF